MLKPCNWSVVTQSELTLIETQAKSPDIKDRPKIDKMKKKKKETKFKKTKTRTSEPKGTNILDSYSPYIYAELLKENNTVDDLDTRGE